MQGGEAQKIGVRAVEFPGCLVLGARRKALVPLYFLMILSFGTFEFDVDDLSNRNGSVSTYFLAAFAMLYVVGEALPKTDFLTKIDKVRASVPRVALVCVGVGGWGG